jgi:hypothetical protein|nr:MAG TPA: hypothetical protein [Caudoviricetes sp.]
MRHLIYLLLLFLTTGCCSSKKLVAAETHTTVVRDSVVLRDSFVVKNLTSYFDSIVVRDSVVLVYNDVGKLLSKERFLFHDRQRKTDIKNTEQNVRQERTQKQKNIVGIKKKEIVKHDFTLTNLARIIAIMIALLVIAYVIYKSRNLWKFLRKMVKP